MSNAALSHPVTSRSPLVPGSRLAIAGVLAVWFAAVLALGANSAFVTPRAEVPIPILFAVSAPLIVFFALMQFSRRFREFLLTIDRRVMVAIQAWRTGGLGFLALYTYGILPALFAWPAAIGDIAVGVTAPFVLFALLRQPTFAASRNFVFWNAFGILDLVVAVSTGALSSGLVPGFVGEVTTTPMAQLPLVLIPAYFVPIFIMLHVAALLQARRLGRELREG
jgi:hypothetical protein